jgi:cation:H+ antiporter
MSNLTNPMLLLIFIGAAIVTWIAGVALARATDVLDDRFGLGEAIGGMILLSVAGSLPEVAIMLSAASSGHLDIAAGNLIGGVAMQTFVLVIADWFGRGRPPLSTAAASLVPALEGLLVIAVVCVTIMGGLLPSSASIGPVGLAAFAIVVIWFSGMIVLNRVRNRPELAFGVPIGSTLAEPLPVKTTTAANSQQSTRRTILVFILASLVTLAAGVLLEQSGNTLADNWGINGILFGATILSLATALPEISSGITGVRMQRYTLVFGDMFGGNAFQLTLFLLADLVAGQPVLPYEGISNAWIGSVGLLMTAVFVVGIITRPSRRYAGLGPDSWVVFIIYLLGLWGLVVVSQ